MRSTTLSNTEVKRRCQAMLEGKCVHCGGLLPRHIGLCFEWTKQFELPGIESVAVYRERVKDETV
ncbi:hypothetical protein N9I83_00270 [bacterium]|nr:hypothetical protein [bacterium]